jgi:O-antigen/teichoic acid export membrane protein
MQSLEDIRDILRGAAASLGGFGSRLIARLVLMVVAGTLYGAAPVGILGQVAAIVEILAAVGTMGLKRSLPHMLSESADTNQQLQIIKCALGVSLLLALSMSGLLHLVWPLLFPDVDMPALLLLVVPSLVFAEVVGGAIRFKRIIRFEVLARCVFEPWSFLLAAVALYFIGYREEGLLLAYAISMLAAAVGLGIGLATSYPMRAMLAVPVNKNLAGRVVHRSVPMGMTELGVIMLRRLDILLLSLVAGHQATGVYYIAQQIVTVPHKIHQLFEPMMSPVLAKLHHAGEVRTTQAKLAGLCRWVFTLQLALTVPFVAFSDELLGLFGDGFAIGGLVLACLLVAELFDGSFALSEIALVYAKPAVPPRLVMAVLGIELVAVYYLGAHWGAEGAALGFLVAMVFFAAAKLISLRKVLGISIVDVAYLPPFALAACFLALLLTLKGQVNFQAPSAILGSIILSVALYLWAISKIAITKQDRAIWAQLKVR